MKRFIAVLSIALFSVWLIASCSNKAMPLSANAGNSNSSTGFVRVNVKLGAVGLAKTTQAKEINLDSLTMDLTATGERPIHVMIPISGNAQQTVSQPFSLAPKYWTVQVRTYAQQVTTYYCGQPQPCSNSNTNTVHSGSANFTVVMGDTSSVNMSVSSQYSMLLIRISQICDSANRVSLFQFNGDTVNMPNPQMYSPWADTTFPIGSVTAKDTIKLRYDWLQVKSCTFCSMQGQGIQVVISGSYGLSTALSWGWLVIPYVTAGSDTSYSFTLKWVGPGNTFQNKTVNVDVGAIGLITVDGAADPSGLSKKK